MKKTNQLLTLLALAILASFTLSSYAQQADFSGHWQLNKSKTIFGGLPEYAIYTALNVTQNDAALVVEHTAVNSEGEEKHNSVQIKLDGKSTQSTMSTGNIETDSVKSKPGAPGLNIGISIKTSANEPFANVTETWTLEDGGKTLVIDRRVEPANGGKLYEITGYYDKQ